MFLTSNNLSGFSLVEVLIAAFILSFGLLGIVSFYSASLQRTNNAYWYSLATVQWQNINEQLAAGDNDCTAWANECAQLLPHGNCKCKKTTVTVCWQVKKEKTCL